MWLDAAITTACNRKVFSVEDSWIRHVGRTWQSLFENVAFARIETQDAGMAAAIFEAGTLLCVKHEGGIVR